MSRLIDADKAYKELIEIIDWIRDQDYETYSAVGDDIRIVLDDQPTAFDADKVAEKLENYFNTTENKDMRLAYHHAIEIVKGGGVE